MTYVLAYDIGTTGVKTCLFSVEERIGLLASAQKGYGLYLVKRTVEAHGGAISAQSGLGRGMGITLTLPLRPAAFSAGASQK